MSLLDNVELEKFSFYADSGMSATICTKATLGINSTYRHFLIKPTENYQEMFNLEREIIVIFSPFE
ncbi:MAG: hypothetical protein WAV70_02670, partial [Anaerolineae bacterium]